MLNVGIIGLGGWGRRLVESVQGKSDRIRFVAAVTATPAKAVAENPRPAATPSSSAKSAPTDEADKMLRNAKVYIDNQLYKDARDRLNNLIAKYPESPAAKEAKELLKKIEKE